MVLTRIVEPYAPASPPLTSSMKVACIGSCFAHEVGESLARSGKDTVPVFVSERLNTPFALAYTVAKHHSSNPYALGSYAGAAASLLPYMTNRTLSSVLNGR